MNYRQKKKVQELEKIFSKIGYFIPKKIYIGGMLIFKSNKLMKNENTNNKKNVKIKRAVVVEGVKITEEKSNLVSENIDIKYQSDRNQYVK